MAHGKSSEELEVMVESSVWLYMHTAGESLYLWYFLMREGDCFAVPPPHFEELLLLTFTPYFVL